MFKTTTGGSDIDIIANAITVAVAAVSLLTGLSVAVGVVRAVGENRIW